MAKAPQPGHCKTRLCPPLTYMQAAGLYRAFLLDTVSRTQLALQVDPIPARIILVHPAGDEQILRSLFDRSIHLQVQSGNDLGTALMGAFEHAFSDGADRVIIISTDSPDMPVSFIHNAIAALDDADAVIGPAEDGGYYLIGLKQPEPRLFEAIAWSTPSVYTQTLGRASEMGIRVHALPSWYDIDTWADVQRLASNLEGLPETCAIFEDWLGKVLSEGSDHDYTGSSTL